jgi:hypothetical protein
MRCPPGSVIVAGTDAVPVELLEVVVDGGAGAVIVLPATVFVTESLPPSDPPQPLDATRQTTAMRNKALYPRCIPRNTRR